MTLMERMAAVEKKQKEQDFHVWLVLGLAISDVLIWLYVVTH